MVDLGQKKVNTRSPFFILTPIITLLYILKNTFIISAIYAFNLLSQYISRLSKKLKKMN